MRIGFDATGVHGRLFGIQSYAKHLLHTLLQTNCDHEFLVFCRGEVPKSFLALADPRVEFVVGGFRNRKMTEQFWLPRATYGKRLDCFHSTYGRPLGPLPPTIHTLHDLFMLRFPKRYSRGMRAYHHIAVERGARQADHVIAVSEATKRDATDLLGLSEEQISVVPLGVDVENFRPFDPALDDQKAFLARHGLPSRYLLHLGGFSPIKNTVRIVDAFAAVAEDMSEMSLVFAGQLDQCYEETRQAVERHGLQDRVHFTDYFSAEDLPELFRYATALVYPSLIEGFGLPLLEAQASGTPVITSDRFSMPEVAGPAGRLVDPNDTMSLAAAMAQVAALVEDPLRSDPDCVNHARKFSWKETARRTLAAYEAIGRAKGRRKTG
jgi:glycosyltransferase involved in cell wall biosynthesis